MFLQRSLSTPATLPALTMLRSVVVIIGIAASHWTDAAPAAVASPAVAPNTRSMPMAVGIWRGAAVEKGKVDSASVIDICDHRADFVKSIRDGEQGEGCTIIKLHAGPATGKSGQPRPTENLLRWGNTCIDGAEKSVNQFVLLPLEYKDNALIAYQIESTITTTAHGQRKKVVVELSEQRWIAPCALEQNGQVIDPKNPLPPKAK